MKELVQYTISLAAFLLFTGCGNYIQNESTEIKNSDSIPVEKFSIAIDTILERNAPESLDLTTHQLFIDTTRNSKYYHQILNWEPNEFDVQGAEYYFNEISKNFEISKVDLKDFPRNWISIHQLNNEFVAYNPTNGMDWRIRLTDSSVNHYAIEADVDIISKIASIKSGELILELRTIPQKRANQIAFLRIKKTTHPYLYSLQMSDTSDFEETSFVELITPLEHLTQFNLVVSDAPMLVHSVVKFDPINRTILE